MSSASLLLRAHCPYVELEEWRSKQKNLTDSCGGPENCPLDVTQSDYAERIDRCDMIRKDYRHFGLSMVSMFTLLSTESYPDATIGWQKVSQTSR